MEFLSGQYPRDGGPDAGAYQRAADARRPVPGGDRFRSVGGGRSAFLRRRRGVAPLRLGDDLARDTAEALASALGDGRYIMLPGSHGTAIATPQFESAITDFLKGGQPASGTSA